MSVRAEGDLVAVDRDGFAYGGDAIHVPLSQGNVSYVTTLNESETSNREELVEQVQSPVARPPSPVPPQEVQEEPVDASAASPPVQEVKEESGAPPAPPAPPAVSIAANVSFAANALVQDVKEEAREEQVEPPAVAPTPAAPPALLQKVKQETKQEAEEDEEDPNVPGPSRGRPTTRKRKVAQKNAQEVEEPPIKRERSETPPAGVKKEPADKQAPESRPTASLCLPPPQQQLLSLSVVLDKIAELKQTPTLLYLDVQVMSEDSGTLLVDYWKDTPECKVLVLRVKEVPLRTKRVMGQPAHRVASTRKPTHFLFYCKPDVQQLREAIVEQTPEPLNFRELAEVLIPVLRIPCALLIPDAEDRNTVNVAALALSNVFVV
ncbi:hypothetical protein M3Y99_00467700 [Aphelenchoides fujianensis]|nr:hypothetical protein M3Y99_00467700 [Aphelenchoides fujianensis]